MSALLQTEHPHVKRNENGKPYVGKVGIPLYVLAEYWRMGWSLEDLATGYPYLAMTEILDGLSYYLDHREEVESLIRFNRPPEKRLSNGE